MTLEELVGRYLRWKAAQGRYGPKSIWAVTNRLGSLVRSFGDRPADQLTREDLEDWIGSLGHLKASSRSSYLSSAKTFTRWAAGRGYLGHDPGALVESIRRPRRVERALSPSQVAAVFAACADDRDRAIVWMMVGCGLRRAEVAAASWENIDLERATIIVEGKNDNERLIPMPAPVIEAIEAVRSDATSGPVIRTDIHDRHVSIEWIGLRVSTLMRQAGIKRSNYDGVSSHALRHTAASDVLDACNDLRVVQAMLGHAHLSSTAIYLRRANLGQLRDAMEGRRYDQTG